MTLPTVTLLLDDGTGTFPFDISRYLMADEGTSFNRGRADWQGAVTAGQLSLTLNNSDGRFTPGSTSIASPSPIKVDQQIRLRETVNGVTYTRFTGYVKSWPTQWPATVGTIAMSTITVTDAQARGERRQLLSLLQEEVLATSPVAYYLLSEPTGAAVAADSSGNQATASPTGTGAAVAFGGASIVATSTATSATFAGGQYLSATAPTLTGVAILAGVAFLASSAPASAQCLLAVNAGALELVVETTGKLALYELGNLMARTSVSVCDGIAHYATGSYTGGGGGMSLDGVGIGSAVQVNPTTMTSTTLTIGGGGNVGAAAFAGRIAQVGLWGPAGIPSAAILWAAMSGSTAVESGTAHIARLAGYANIPLGTIDTSLTNVPFTDFADDFDWPQIQQTADAELGVAYINGSGSLDFHNRDRVRVKVSPDLTLVATSYVTPDVQPVVDDQQILNYVEATSSVTGITQVVRNTASETAHGRYSDSQTYSVSTDTEALDRANWVVVNFAEPTTRYGTLTINLFAMPASLASSVLAAIDLDCWLRVALMASQNPTGTTADVVVQGFTETCTADSWFITCNVVLRSLYNALILDNATYGVLDSSLARLGV